MTRSVDDRTMRETLGFEVADVFRSHLDCADIAELEQLAGRIDSYLAELEHAAAGRQVNVDLARRIAGRCRQLLDGCDRTDGQQLRLVVAAVRYFLDPDDIDSDDQSPAGLDDDALVLNAVIRWTGLPVPEVDPG